MTDEPHNTTRRPPRGQEHEDYLQTIEAFHTWCEDRGLPFRPTHNHVLQEFMAPKIKLAAPTSETATPAAINPSSNLPDDTPHLEKYARARQLLIDTDLPLGDIAAMCGWGSRYGMADVFRKHAGQSPGQFRAANQKGAFTDERSSTA